MKLSDFVILMVEDEDDQIFLTTRALSKASLVNPLRIVKNGEDAIAYLSGEGAYADRKANPLPSLVLLDLKLPRKSGFEVLSWVRGQPSLKTLPIAILTSSINPDDHQRAAALGVNAYLSKPVAPEGLIEMMKSIGMYWMILNRNGTASPEQLAEARPAATSPADLRVLVVDPDRDFAAAIAAGLSRRSPPITADVAADLEAAAEAAVRGRYDALVVDREALAPDELAASSTLALARGKAPLLLLGAENDRAFVASTLRHKASGSLLKGPRIGRFIDDLHRTLHEVIADSRKQAMPDVPNSRARVIAPLPERRVIADILKE